jgi:hypothetical protein
MTLSSSTLQRLFAAFLVRFAGGDEGAGRTLVAWAAQAAGARAGSMVEPLGLVGDVRVSGGVAALTAWPRRRGRRRRRLLRAEAKVVGM